MSKKEKQIYFKTMTIIKSLKAYIRILRYIPHSIYFNFHYLSLNQAIKLPILLYKPHLLKCKGEIRIDSDNIHLGMIRLGFFQVSLYPNTGIVFENHGGICIFKGHCSIGNASAISIGKTGKITFGDRFLATANLRLTSYCEIKFGDRARCGWENIFMDTNFHKLTKVSGGYTKGFAPIIIGDNNWFGLKCVVLKGTQTPDYCTIGGNSVLNKKYEYQPYSVIAGNPVSLKAVGVYRNIDDDVIEYDAYQS